MSDPIQRKGPGGVTGPTDGAPTEGAGAAFRAAVDGARSGGVEGAHRSEIAAIATEVRSGALDARAAVERLVQRALASGTAATLGPAQRERLAEMLRAQLAEDPTLQALQRDLERSP